MSTYLWVILGVIVIPFAFSFEKKISFFRKWPGVMGSLLIVSPIFLLWDTLATARGDWGFNPQHVLGIRFAGLPLEEILFFVAVPYSCLFTYEVLRFFRGDQKVKCSRSLPLATAALMLACALLRKESPYTYIVFMFGALTLFIVAVVGMDIFRSRLFWTWILLCQVFFFIVNFILTALPVVTYNEAAISGSRILSIPAEDLLYNFCMLTLYLLVYERFFPVVERGMPVKIPGK